MDTDTLNQKKHAKKTLENAEKATHVSELKKVEAAQSNFEVHAKVEKNLAIAEAQNFLDNANQMVFDKAEKAITDVEFKKVCPRPHYGYCPHRKCGPLKCTFCRLSFETRYTFVEHHTEARTETTKCELCGNKLNCMALFCGL